MKKAALFFMLALISIVIWEMYDQKQICSERDGEIKKFLTALKGDPIGKIEILKPAKGHKSLINRKFIIDNDMKIDSIRNLIIDRKVEKWQKPISKWEVILVFYFTNGLVFKLEVNLIENSEAKNRTHIYFNMNPCTDSLPSYSDYLGRYLEKTVRQEAVK